MKKIKINEAQAKMLTSMSEPKVLKITKEQYNRILESEGVQEDITSPIGMGFNQQISKEAKPTFRKELNKASLREMYEDFLNELYNVNEGIEQKYEGLIGLMEVAKLIQNRRLSKESFNDRIMAEKAIGKALYEMANGASKYKAMESLEEVINGTSDITPDYLGKQLAAKPKTGKSPEELKKAIASQRAKSNQQTIDTLGYDPEAEVTRDEAVDALADGMKKDQHDMKKETVAKMKEEEGRTTWTGEEILNHPLLVKLPDGPKNAYGKDRMNINLPVVSGGGGSIASHKEDVMRWIHEFPKHFDGQEPVVNANMEIINKGYDETIKNRRDSIGQAIRGAGSTNEMDSEGSNGQSTGGGGLANTDNAVHKPNVVASLKTDNDYEEPIDDSIIDEMTDGAIVGNIAYDAPGAIGGKIDGEDDIDMLAGNKEAPTMPMVKGKIAEDDGETRYVVDLDFYVWATSDDEAKNMAKSIANEIDSKYDNRATITGLSKQPQGTIGNTPVSENAQTTPQYPGGTIIKAKEKCKKFPYCDEGPGNFDEVKSSKAVVSNEANLYEAIGKKTGRSLNEVKVIVENWLNDEADKSIRIIKQTNEAITKNPNTVIELSDEGSSFLIRVNKTIEVNEEEKYVRMSFEISYNGMEGPWKEESKSRDLTGKAFSNKYSYETQNDDCRLIQNGIENAKHNMATDIKTLNPIKKEIS